MRVLVLHSAGLGDLVETSLSQEVDARSVFSDGSAILIETPAAPAAVARLPYLKNAYQVLGSVPRRGSVEASLGSLTKAIGRWQLPSGRRPFRVMISDEGQLAPVSPRSRARLEEAIGRRTGGTVNPRGGRGDEFWVLTRRGYDEVIFGLRLERPKAGQAAPGALRPDLAALLVDAAGCRRQDVFLDPFAGSGTLPLARLQKPVRQVILSDLAYDTPAAPKLPAALTRSGKVLRLTEDARTLPSVADRSIDTIVTDPPWGEFESLDDDVDDFLAAVLVSFDRVLSDHGRLLMLVSRRLAESADREWARNGLHVRSSYDILVNGHPATALAGGR